MGSNDGNSQKAEKKRPRVSSSSANESIEQIEDGACIKLTVTEYQSLIAKLTAVEDAATLRDKCILNLEARLDEAQNEIQGLKTKLKNTQKAITATKESIKFTQNEQDDLVERKQTSHSRE